MMALAFAAAAAVQEPPRPRLPQPRNYRPTVTMLTEPVRDLDCRLSDRRGRSSPLRLRLTGTRGYRSETGAVRATQRKVELLSDPDGLLESLPVWRADGETILFGSEARRSSVLWSVSPPPLFATVVLVRRREGMARQPGDPAWTGFCNVTETPQTPLTAENAFLTTDASASRRRGLVTADRMRTSALTPAQLTKSLMDLDCSLADRAGREHRVKLKVSGGRGYGEPWAGGTLTTHTPQHAEVISDPSGLFQRLPFLEDKLNVLIFGRFEGPLIEFRSYAAPTEYSVVTLTQRRSRWDRAPDEATFAGHCAVRETAQQPLDEAETRAFLAASANRNRDTQ